MRSKEQIESDYSIIPPMLHVSFTDSDGIRKKSWQVLGKRNPEYKRDSTNL